VPSFLAQLALLQAAEDRPEHKHSSLTELEARAPSENQYPRVDPAFHHEVVLLVESNTLASGDEFLRAATIAASPFPDCRSFGMRYELALTAVAVGRHEAEKLLPSYWDDLLQTLSRPMQGHAFYEVEGAPKCVCAAHLMLHAGHVDEGGLIAIPDEADVVDID